jgi:hypothetical protein
LLLQEWLSPSESPILATDADWLTKLQDRLINHGRAVLSVRAQADALNTAIAVIAVTPVQLEYLNVYPKLVSIVRSDGDVRLELELEATV